MLIYPKPSKDCGICEKFTDCPCLCHKQDVINSKHYEIHFEEMDIKVKPVKDLDHFRD